jgi:hypothetical protein
MSLCGEPLTRLAFFVMRSARSGIFLNQRSAGVVRMVAGGVGAVIG